MVALEAWEPAHYALTGRTSALLFTLEPPKPRLNIKLIKI